MDINDLLQSIQIETTKQLEYCKEEYNKEINDVNNHLNKLLEENYNLNQALKSKKSQAYRVKHNLKQLLTLIELCKNKKYETDMRDKLKLINQLANKIYELSKELTR